MLTEEDRAKIIESSSVNSARNLSANRYMYILIALWTVLIVALALRQISFNRDTTQKIMINEARSMFDRDQAFRLWGASHGGVYVPISDIARPNPYLINIDDRDVETTTGKKLTLINPTYMIRLMYEHFADLYGVVGHITSLKPLNPINAADDWEAKALKAFEKGTKEVYEFMGYMGEKHLRLMQPLVTKESCLKCHDHQGYQVGDIRGGISISIKTAPYEAMELAQTRVQMVSFALIWVFGIIGIVIGISGLKKRMKERNELYDELANYKVQLEMLVKKRTAELEDANESLEDKVIEVKNANEEIKNFTHIVSHDLKNPITSIMGMSELLLQDFGDKMDESGRHYIDRIRANSMLMNDLLKGLLELARIGRIEEEKEPVDTYNLLRQIADENQLAVRQGGVDVEIDKNLPTITFSRIRLYQVFSNLFKNALKFMRDEGDSKLKVTYEAKGGEHIIAVSDNGIGIREGDFKKIFVMFSRAKEKKVEGTGIGLAIVKKIMDENDCRIWVESEVGAGSTFYVAFHKE